jgi:hypothetical protein
MYLEKTKAFLRAPAQKKACLDFPISIAMESISALLMSSVEMLKGPPITADSRNFHES